MWVAVRQRFSQFHADLVPTPEQVEDAFGKAKRVGQALQRAYDIAVTDDPATFPVGSWGKVTQVRPSADIDIMAQFSSDMYWRFDAYTSNGQSALLQEIKDKLSMTFSQTVTRGDGQVVQVDFNSILVEIVPVFARQDGKFQMPDTHGGGSWKTVDPFAQIKLINDADRDHNGNVRPLIRMIKRWKHERNVELKSFLIEMLVVEFLNGYGSSHYDWLWFDWYVRDCLKYIRSRVNGWITIPGTGELVFLGEDWLSKIDTAIGVAELACQYERLDFDVTAGEEWQKIFGPRIPLRVL